VTIPNPRLAFSAAQDFQRARRKAAWKEIMARLTGKSIGLLSYEDVRKKLRARPKGTKVLKDIPLDAIVGSVGRYNDFTRDFLPLKDMNQDRWVKIKSAISDMRGVPPIDVYKIGEVYFVIDGNHRVSVARQMGSPQIQAYVTELKTRVPLTPEVKPEELIIKARYADFLERTHLDELRPGADLNVTLPGKYRVLDEHIQTHRYFMGKEQKREIPFDQAVTHWYDHVYMPVIEVIREQGLLKDFPERTETDLYLWIMEHRVALEKEVGWAVNTSIAASDLVEQYGGNHAHRVTRLGERILEAIVPDELEPGPPPGEWRRLKETEESSNEIDEHLFKDLLVPISEEKHSWRALDQALIIAQREKGRLLGLHVVDAKDDPDGTHLETIQEQFQLRCKQVGITGMFSTTTGIIANQICLRSRFSDMIVVGLAYPPADQPLSRLSSGFGSIVRRCPRPILAVPGEPTPLNRALLSFDGSPKAEEALYLATYLAGKWHISLSVLTVLDSGKVNNKTLKQAQNYIETHAVSAEYIKRKGSVAEEIMKVAEDQEIDFLIMGGYGAAPVMEVVLGSSVDQVLRESHRPVLICR
jgi:nucleotide-binding universal stress UspA family protein